MGWRDRRPDTVVEPINVANPPGFLTPQLADVVPE